MKARCIKSDPMGILTVGDLYEIESVPYSRWPFNVRRLDNHTFVMAIGGDIINSHFKLESSV